MSALQVCLVSEVDDINGADLYRLARALEISGRHCAEVWGIDPPAVDVIDRRTTLPRGCAPIVLMERETDPGALAVHYYDPIALVPAARVLCQRGTGFNAGRQSIAESASHELVELMVDPKIDQWRPMPGYENADVALENADPVQTHYLVESSGEQWRMANFVTPDWFRTELLDEQKRVRFLDEGGKFDFRGELTRPGEIGPYGYAILRRDGKVYSLRGRSAQMDASKYHPWARTSRRLRA